MTTNSRNLTLFTLVTLACGWAGAWLNAAVPSPSPQQSLGLLLWLIAPLLSALLLRWLGKDGWRDFGLRLNLRGHLAEYALALGIYPLCIALAVGLGAALGGVSLEGLASQGAAALVPVLVAGFVGSLFKNVFEEFAWRGYLTPRFQALGLGRLQNHLLTGLIWGLWHIPYWLFFLGAGLVDEISQVGMFWFIVLALLGIFPTAIVYGELRLRSGSLWPAFLAHNITNAISGPLLLEGFVRLNDPLGEVVFSPNPGGLVMMALFWAVGLWLLSRRLPAPA
jgi:membrane protease YdiL (CAAX protease family)